eukprot:359846-Chlamydomonas_euryale.AAC.1
MGCPMYKIPVCKIPTRVAGAAGAPGQTLSGQVQAPDMRWGLPSQRAAPRAWRWSESTVAGRSVPLVVAHDVGALVHL